METSPVHTRSACAVVDPFYTTESQSETDQRAFPWIYGECELECFLLRKMRQDVAKAKLNVGYPGEFKDPDEHAYFKAAVSGVTVLHFRACGSVRVAVNNQTVYQNANRDEVHVVTIKSGCAEIILELNAPEDVPALYVEGHCDVEWKWSANSVDWTAIELKYSKHPQIPPHREKPPMRKLRPESLKNGIYDFGREIVGAIYVRAKLEPEIFIGESIAEALNREVEHFEQSIKMEYSGDHLWVSSNNLALRYLVCEGADVEDTYALIPCPDLPYRGAFSCSDEMLTKIWSCSAYTLRLCMDNFMLDGVKRDRLPWVGDLAMSLMVNAYAFADGTMIRQTLSVLGRAGIVKSHLNGIVDYSLWWVISHDLYQLYFADREYLLKEWSRIKHMCAHLQGRCDGMGMLNVAEDDWLFIDWVREEKITALQVLWQWAQNAMANLAERIGERETVDFWRQSANKLKEALYNTAWDSKQKLWRGTPGMANSSFSRHALFLSVVSGLLSSDDYSSARSSLLGNDLAPVGTPYMAGFEHLALSMLGATPQMLQRTRAYWGGMLEHGATTFWEAYNPDESDEEKYSFYGRPFGKSLCHAWSAGPAAFLPQGILGLRPLEDGWKRFSLSPCAGSLSWIAVTLPSPCGAICITIEDNMLNLQLPVGVVAEYKGDEIKETCSIPLS